MAGDVVARDDVALFRHVPQLHGRVPWVSLGNWPTAITAHELDLTAPPFGGTAGRGQAPRGGSRTLWIKHEGDSHPRYGGNKLRTLEAWLGHARAEGAERIWAIGAYGSNHAIATVIHAPRAGLDAGAVLFPQPRSTWAIENASALIASGCPIIRLRSVVEVPFVGLAIAARARREGRRAIVMPPGGATPIGTFGALSAAFELAEQLAAGAMPAPKRVVLPAGSTCTTAGLLAGTALAGALGLWRGPLPIIHAVRVTPWPVTSRLRIASLASRTLARVAQLGGSRHAIDLRALLARLVVDGAELGGGYGRSTERATQAAAELATAHGPRLDSVYAAKAAAALVRLHREGHGPLLFWSSKSTAVLAGTPASADALAAAPRALADWVTSFRRRQPAPARRG